MGADRTGETTVITGIPHALWRFGVRSLLRAAGGFTVIGEAGTSRDMFLLVARHQPDIVLMDVDLIAGPSATSEAMAGEVASFLRHLASLGVSCRLLLLGSRAFETHLLPFIGAGAAGFVLKDATPAELVCALHEVQRVDFYVSPDVSRKVLNRWHRSRQSLAGGPARGSMRSAHDLSEREGEVLACVVSGLQNREIARQLQISVKTVEAHKAKIVSRLGLRGASDLVRFAAQVALRHQEDALGGEMPSATLG